MMAWTCPWHGGGQKSHSNRHNTRGKSLVSNEEGRGEEGGGGTEE